jgi:hypothetical protein
VRVARVPGRLAGRACAGRRANRPAASLPRGDGVDQERSAIAPRGGADGIYELKGDFVRIFYFNFEGRIIVCSHRLLKPKKKQVLAEAKKAERLRDQIAKAARERRLVIEEDQG